MLDFKTTSLLIDTPMNGRRIYLACHSSLLLDRLEKQNLRTGRLLDLMALE